MLAHPETPTRLEDLLRDTCRRAMAPDLSFIDRMRLYRSVLALAREVRLTARGRTSAPEDRSLESLLFTVCDHVCALGLDPERSLPHSLRVQRLAAQLSRAARLAGSADSPRQRISEQNPMHREKAPPLPPEPPTRPAAEAPDDQKTGGTLRADALLRIVMEERAFAKIRAQSQRDREVSATTRLASPVSANARLSEAEFPPPDVGFDRAFARRLARPAAE